MIGLRRLTGLPAATALLLLVGVGCTKTNQDHEEWPIVGRVVDEQQQPLDDFVAAELWSANGKTWYYGGYWRDDGDGPVKINGLAAMEKLWKDEGVLAPYPPLVARHSAGGQFTLTSRAATGAAVFATDSQQRRGGFATAAYGSRQPLTIQLRPLVRVTGKIFCSQAERTPDWTMAVVHAPGDAHNDLLIARCGSLKGEFSFLLPPGKYDLQAYSQSPDAAMPRAAERADAPADMGRDFEGIRIEVPSHVSELNLGIVDVGYPAGRGDYSSYYGREPPPLELTDAHGISKDVELHDFRGKWLLLEFWSPACGNCIAGSLPELTNFYQQHTQDRDRFAVLSICVTKDSGIRTLAEFEPFYLPLVEQAWNGKELPFPVLIDGDGKTQAAFGVEGYPSELLIDPGGHLVKWGDRALLAEKLSSPPSSPE